MIDSGNTSKKLYADRRYTDKQREQGLRVTGYDPQIQHKAKRGKPLSDCQGLRNHRISQTRCRVEHVFGAMKQMGGGLMRTVSLARATFQLNLKVACYNLCRLSYL